jgi:mitochondrial translocator assembly and maintenance protein 41
VPGIVIEQPNRVRCGRAWSVLSGQCFLRQKSEMLSESDSQELLKQFPEVSFAFAYGSGVVEQGGYDYSKPQESLPLLDLIFVVDNAEAWHAKNMLLNPHHYTPLVSLSPHWIAKVQDKIPSHFWFNAYIPVNISAFPARLMKYGVVSKKHMIRDLTKWTDLYVAGRLHKPVHVLKENDEIERAIGVNHEQAVRASLLLLPEKFNEVDLYLTIASLSYTGDPRMYVGENPNKVRHRQWLTLSLL